MSTSDNFRTSEIVVNPTFLFGRVKRGQTLDKAILNLRRGTNTEILGERRSGKTSTISCIINILEKDYKDEYIPIYLNFKDNFFIKGTFNSYRFILSKFFEKLSQLKFFAANEAFYGTEIQYSKKWEDYYIQFTAINDYTIHGLLSNLPEFFSNLLEKTIVLFFDEYEYYLYYTLDDIEGFFPIRSLSEKPEVNGMKPLIFIICGATSWDKIEQQTGSPILNTLGAEILYLSPLNIEDFTEMWHYLISPMSNKALLNTLSVEDLYIRSGGIPFFLKLIGNNFIDNKTFPSIDLFIPYFEDIYKNLDEKENKIVSSILDKLQVYNDPSIRKLIKRGILINDKGNYQINGTYLSEYFKYKIGTENKFLDSKANRLQTKVDLIAKLISKISQTSMNKMNTVMFEPSIDDYQLFTDLKTLCIDEEDIIRFSSSLYRIAFEKTRTNSSLDNLPKGFRKDHHSILLIDQFRHHSGGHLTSVSSFRPAISRGDLLEKLTGSRNEPENEDYDKIQLTLLELYIAYLKDLLNFIKKNNSW
jgi:hypothetical protein